MTAKLLTFPGQEISEVDALIIDAMTTINRLVELRARGVNLSRREVELWQVLNSYQWLVSSMRATSSQTPHHGAGDDK